MAAFNKIDQLVADLANGVHNFTTHTVKVMLTNSAPVSSNTIKGNLTEISAANGYAAGGLATTVISSTQTSGLYKLVLTDITFTASGGSVGPFRYAVIYNDTPTSPLKPLVGWYDYGSSITLGDGESLVVDFNQSTGTFTLQ